MRGTRGAPVPTDGDRGGSRRPWAGTETGGGPPPRRGPGVSRGWKISEPGFPAPTSGAKPNRGSPKTGSKPRRGSSGRRSPCSVREVKPRARHRPGYLLLRKKVFLRGKGGTSGVKQEPVGASRPGLLPSPSRLGWRIRFAIFGSRPPASKSRCAAAHAPPAFRESQSP